jgi:hypothetical protein
LLKKKQVVAAEKQHSACVIEKNLVFFLIIINVCFINCFVLLVPAAKIENNMQYMLVKKKSK